MIPVATTNQAGRFRLLLLLLLSASMQLAAADRPPAVLCGSEPGYPPYCITNEDGKADGFSVQLLRAALQAVGREATFRVAPWPDLKGDLAEGRLQALPLVGRTPEREAVYDFTFPYYSAAGAIIVRAGEGGIHSVEDLSGKDVAVLAGDNAEEYLRRELPEAVVVALPSFETALRELANGMHDAVVIQKLLAVRLIRNNRLSGLHVLDAPVPGFQQQFCFAVREGDRHTLALLNDGLAAVIADGTFRKLHAQWFAPSEIYPNTLRITVGGDANYPPYNYLDENGEATGFSVELLQAVAREVGITVSTRLETWAQTRERLERGEMDALQGMIYSAERDAIYDFTQPHASIHYVIVTRQDAPQPQTLSDLIGLQILLQDGDIMHDRLVAQDRTQGLLLASSQEEALRRLSSGEGDAALVARLPAMYWMERHGYTNLRLSETPILAADYCFAVPHGRPELLARLSEGLAAVERSGEYRTIYNRWLAGYDRHDQFWLLMRYATLVSVAPALLLLVSLLWSRSLRRRVEQRTAELARSQATLKAALDNSHVGIVIADTSGEMNYLNRTGSDILGPPDDISDGGRMWRLLDANRQPLSSDDEPMFRAMREGSCSCDIVVQRIDGTERDLLVHAAQIRDDRQVLRGGIAVFMDVTERRRAERELRETAERLDLAKQASRIGTWDWDYATGRLIWDERIHEIYGTSPGSPTMTLDLWQSRLHPDDRQRILDELEQIVASDRSFLQMVFRVVRPDGTARHVECTGTILRKPDGRPVRVTGVNIDVTEFALLAEALRLSEAEYRRLSEHYRAISFGMPDGLALHEMIYDESGKAIDYRFLETNPAFESLTGLVAEQVIGRTVRDVLPGTEQAWIDRYAEVVETGTPCRFEQYSSELGRHFEVSAFRPAPGQFACVFADRTEARKLQDQLRHAEKMQAIGELAGGIAHDFNNQLVAVLGYADILTYDLENDRQRRFAEQIRIGASRASELTKQLLAFARKGKYLSVPVDLHRLLAEVVDLLEHSIDKRVRLHQSLHARHPVVLGDPTQLQNALLNIALNARDAMPDGGSLTFQSDDRVLDREFCQREPEGLSPGRYVVISITDTGLGIDRSILPRIFEPFFTTKKEGRGTGMGLAGVYGAVRSHRGVISVYSEPGHGTTFRIYLPATDLETAAETLPLARPLPAPRSANVLLVDDEPMVRGACVDMLLELGYEVHACADGDEAIAYYREHWREVDVVILDMVMPGLGGREVYRAMREINPAARVLLSSGYSLNGEAQAILNEGVFDFVGKPYLLDDLAKKVAEALE